MFYLLNWADICLLILLMYINIIISDSKCIPKAKLFFLSFMDHFISQSVTYCVKHLPELVDPNIDHVKLNRRRRRRGFRQRPSPDSQESSEGG